MKLDFQNKNLFSLDFLRGLASVSVFLFHISINSKLKFSTGFKELFSLGHLGVQIFFVISGFIIPFSMKKGNYSLKKILIFFKKRVTRLHPPYLISIILILCINGIFHLSPYFHEEWIKIHPIQLLAHFLYLNDILNQKWLNEVYWTLAIEFQYYIFISVIFVFLNTNKIVWFCLLGVLLTSSIVFPYHNLITGHLPFFLIGMCFYRLFIKIDSFITFILYFTLIACTILYVYNFKIEYIIAGIIPILFFLLINKNLKIYVFFGNISYSLYLLHAPVSQALIKVGSYFSTNIVTDYLLIIMTFITTITISYFFYRFIELPCKNLTSKLRY